MNCIKILVTTLLLIATKMVFAQQVQTIAGNVGTKSGVDALQVRLGIIKSSAIDAAGNIYYADDYWIMKKDAITGIVSKFAGTGVSESNSGKISATGSCASCVGIFTTAYLSIDQKNNLLYITSNDVNLLKLDLKTNLIYSAAGGGVQYGNNGGDGGLATNATIPGAQKVQTDSSGNIYFMQNFLDLRIRKINKATGIITTILGGNSNTPSLDGSLGINATIKNGVFAVDLAGNVFYFDNNKIRKLDNKTGIISTIAGQANPGNSGDGGLAKDAQIAYPSIIHVDNQNNIYMYGGNSIRKINGSDLKINTIAGTGKNSDISSGDGGLATLANFNRPVSITTDNANNIYIVDDADFSIRKIDALTNIITRVVGAPTFSGDGGLAKSASLNEPGAISMDKSGNVYIADVLNHRIRKHNKATGIITTFAGNGLLYSGAVNSNSITSYYNGKNANDVSINKPVAIAIDSSENLFIADQGLKVIFKVALATGKINIFAGHNPTMSPTNTSIGDGGDGSNASFNIFTGLAIDNYNDIYVTDLNNTIRKINSKTNIITTVVGSYNVPSQNGFSGDGGLATKAKIFNPRGLSFDANNNLYFSDYQNQVLRKVDFATGIITTIAGLPNIFGFDGDGGSSKEATLWNSTGGMAIDKKNNILYFSDNDNSRIRRINLKNGIISTLVGTGQPGFNGDTFAPLDTKVSFKVSTNTDYLNGIVVDSVGDVYFSDRHNHLIRKIIEPMKVALPPSADTILPHKITIHRDKFISLEMSQDEYNDWVKNDFFTYGPKSIKLLKEIYTRFKDNFDFLICNLNEPINGPTQITYSGVNVPVSNKVLNIGRDIMDLADSYGASNGRLKANVQLVGSNITNSPLIHEIAHTYVNFTIDSVGFFGSGLTDKMLRGHWGFTGGNTRGQLGGFTQSTLKENVNGISNKYSVASFGQIANGGNTVPLSEFELYNMGIIPLDSVKTFDVFRGIQTLSESNGVSTFTANSRTTFNKAKIESTLGVRVPSAADAQKDFNALFIVLTPKALTTAQIDQYDNQIIKMTKRGDDSTVFYNFWEATNGLGTLNASGLQSQVATGTIERLDSNACAGSVIRFKAYPLMNGGIRAAYQWYKNGKEISGENLNLFSTSDLKNSDTISCKIKNSVDSVISSIIIRNVYQYPNAPIATSISYCVGANAVALKANETSGNSLVWYGTSATGGVSGTSAPIPSTSTAGTYIYYVSQKHSISSCESPRTALVVTVNQNPVKPSITRDVNNNLVSSATLGNQWYIDTTAVITGQTVQSYKPTIAGYYAVKVTSNNCRSPFSDRYYYLVTALENFTNGQFIHLYPNPATNDLMVNFNLPGQSQLSITMVDPSGKIVISNIKMSKGSRLDISELKSGMYFVQVFGKNNQLLFTDKLIKE
ncbi:MAG: T9SS type A sorting domain-containing protein [Bacteroidota bacterium]|jgi:sugar lactone lactonase YvrE